MSLPLLLINGVTAGPRLYLEATMHGDEVSGIEDDFGACGPSGCAVAASGVTRMARIGVAMRPLVVRCMILPLGQHETWWGQ